MISGVLDSIRRLKEEVASGTMPAYIGEPMVKQLIEKVKNAQALQQGAPTATVVDQINQEAQALFRPQGIQQVAPHMAAPQQPIPQQIPPQNPQPQPTQVAGIDAAQSNLPAQGMAGGGIVAFAGQDGSLVDDDYDPNEDEANEEYYAAMEAQDRMAQMIANQQADSDALTQAMLERRGTGRGATVEPAAIPTTLADLVAYKKTQSASPEAKSSFGGIKADQYSGDKDQARKYNVGNLRPSGFTYKGQVGVSPGGFAMFDSREAGIAALNQDINAKLNRGLDTPTKFISVYAPASDKNDVKAYSANVAKALGIGPNDKIPNTPEARQLLANAITRQEGAQYATARFAEGGIVKLVKGGLPPYTTTSGTGIFVVDPAGNVMDKEKWLRGMSPWERYIKPGLKNLYGRPSVAGTVVPAAIAEGGTRLGEASMNTMAGNPYFEGYSDPFMGDLAVGNAIINQNPEVLALARKPKEEVKAPEIKVPEEKELDAYLPPDVTPEVKPEEKGETKRSPLQEAIAGFMESQKKREAKLEKQEMLGKYMSALQGFLGMMQGTSPYLFPNIGQGASSGITALMNFQKMQGANERAFGRDQLGVLQMQRMVEKDIEDRSLREKLGIGALEEKYSDNVAAVNTKRSETLRKVLEDNPTLKFGYESARKKVEEAYRLGKTPDPADLSNYESYKNRMKELESQINKRLPMPTRPGILGGSRPGVIKLD